MKQYFVFGIYNYVHFILIYFFQQRQETKRTADKNSRLKLTTDMFCAQNEQLTKMCAQNE